MRFKEYLGRKLGDSISNESMLPSGYHLVGHVALLQLNNELMKWSDLIGKAVLDYDTKIKSVAVKLGPTTGVTRSPDYVLVAGETQTVTVHVEDSVKFRLDPLRITFSGGNKGERIRISDLVDTDEVVVDMFACVGQFTLHIAKKKRTEVIAIEINPEAFAFLDENVKLNRLEKYVKIIQGDSRIVHPKHVADRVIMGYLHDTIDFLPYALETLSDSGGVIHMHMAIPAQEIINSCNTINTLCSANGFSSSVEYRKIKHYSPGVEHYVFDIEVSS